MREGKLNILTTCSPTESSLSCFPCYFCFLGKKIVHAFVHVLLLSYSVIHKVVFSSLSSSPFTLRLCCPILNVHLFLSFVRCKQLLSCCRKGKRVERKKLPLFSNFSIECVIPSAFYMIQMRDEMISGVNRIKKGSMGE